MGHHYTKKERLAKTKNWRDKWSKSVTGMVVRNAESGNLIDDDIREKIDIFKNGLNIGDKFKIASNAGNVTHVWVVVEKHPHTLLCVDEKNPKAKLSRSYVQLYMDMYGHTTEEE